MIREIVDFFRPYSPKDYWEARGSEYIKEYKEGRRAFAKPRHMLEHELVRFLKDVRFASLAEVGCNFGKNLKLIRDAFPKKRLAGIDISTTALAEARGFLEGCGVELYNSDAVEMPFKDREFDVVVAGEVFEHVPYERFSKTLDECVRITARYLIFISPDHLRTNPLMRWFRARHAFIHDYRQEIAERKELELLSMLPVECSQVLIFTRRR